jgi:DNA-binding CsgD family transcriptional regulator
MVEGFGDSNRMRREAAMRDEAAVQKVPPVELSAPRGLAIDVFQVGDEEFALLSINAPEFTPRQELSNALSPAERAVIECVLRGQTVAEIALARGVSPLTVRNQIRSTYAKLGVSSRGELGRRVTGGGR